MGERRHWMSRGLYSFLQRKEWRSPLKNRFFFIHRKFLSAVRRAELLSDRTSYRIILRGSWCNIIVLNVHAPRKDNSDDVKDVYIISSLGMIWKISCDFNGKVGREDILEPTTGKESPHEISNDKGVRVANFATSKNILVKVPCFHIMTFTNTTVPPLRKRPHQTRSDRQETAFQYTWCLIFQMGWFRYWPLFASWKS
jgi:hypothetical protein